MSPIIRSAGVLDQPPDGPSRRPAADPLWSDPLTSAAHADLPELVAAPRGGILKSSDPLSQLLDSRAAATVEAIQHAAAPAASQVPIAATSSAAAHIDLDAIGPAYHLGSCICSACSGIGRQPQDGASATTLSGSASAAPAAAASLQTLATYLTTGYWQESGTFTRRYNLSSSGTGAKSGTLTFNVTGWANDSNGLSAERQALAREVFKVYGAVLGITFREVSGESGDLRFTDNDTGAYAYANTGWYNDASQTSVTLDQSVINVEAGWYGGQSGFSTYTPQTFFHEIGHALGLGHQGQYNYTGTPLTYASSAQFANDSWQATMMSYWDQLDNTTTGASFAWLQTPMAVDWIALNDLYGAPGYGVANAFRSDTVYGVGTTISASQSRIWNEFSTWAGSTAYTLVDGGGYDTLDVSNFNAAQLINLASSQPGSTTPSISNIGGLVGNLTIAAGTLIEAATAGGGNDSLLGNEAANSLRGGAGDDRFWESAGSDTYYGDAGNDWLYFSESLDLFSYAVSGDSLLFSRRSGSTDTERVWSGLENLSFNNVAYTYQQLIDSLAAPALPDVTISSINGLASGAATNSTSLSISGSLSAALASGQMIAVYRNGVQVGSAEPSQPGGTGWNVTLQEAAGTNAVTYSARVIETASSRQGALSQPFQLTVDTEIPLVSVNPLETQDTTPVLSGTISDATAQVSIRIGDSSRTALNNGNGSWSLSWETPLAAGLYDVIATATDAAGNSGSDSSVAELNLLPDDYSADSSSSGRVAVGGSSSGVLELSGDRDWFAVDLQAGRSYDFRMDGISLADPLLSLYSSSGSVLASNNNLSATSTSALINFRPASSGRYYLAAAAAADAGAGSYSVSATDVTPPPGTPILHFSLASSISTASSAVLGGLTARTNDIIAFDGTRFSLWLDGNASGLSGAVLRDFHLISNDEVVVAFNSPVSLAGISFDDSDLARLSRTASGGFSISMLFDGSDVGLTTTAEAIDAVTGLSDGSWLISTRGGGGVSGVSSFAAEDLIRFRPTALGAATSGTWSLYADMSDVGISGTSENITAVDVASDGRIALVTTGTVSATGLSAANEDVALFRPSALGSTTSGSFVAPLQFDGSVHGLAGNALFGLDLPF